MDILTGDQPEAPPRRIEERNSVDEHIPAAVELHHSRPRVWRFDEELPRRHVPIVEERTVSIDLPASGDGDVFAFRGGDKALAAPFRSDGVEPGVAEVVVTFRHRFPENLRSRRNVQFDVAAQIECAGKVDARLKHHPAAAGLCGTFNRLLDGGATLFTDKVIHIQSF